jgi:hypothetical protein
MLFQAEGNCTEKRSLKRSYVNVGKSWEYP